MRRRPHPAHENHERWLVSYADFITLLFAFFVVMFASSQKNRAKEVSASVREALEHGTLSATISTALGKGKHEANKVPVNADPSVTHETPAPAQPEPHPADLKKSLAQLQANLAEELKSGKVVVRLENRGLVIGLREAAFFNSGDDAVVIDSLPILAKVAAAIRDLPNPIRLEGHTDSRPIHNQRFRNNWQLSTARGVAMLELLQNRFQIDTARLAVAGYAENAPTDTNDTDEGRAHNRRVDVVVLSAEAVKIEPGQAGATAGNTSAAGK